MNVAFDVGADDGFHGILFAFINPKIKVSPKLTLSVVKNCFLKK